MLQIFIFQKGFEHNFGSFITISIILFHNICIFIFYRYQLNKIEETIDDITLSIKNIKSPKKIKKRRRKSNIKVNQKKPILNLKKIDNFQNELNLPKKQKIFLFLRLKRKIK